MTDVRIADIVVGDGHPTVIVGELGTNHGGDVKQALRLIDICKAAGADAIKFQKRTPELAVPEAEWNDLRETPWGKMKKIDYRKRVEFGLDEYREIDAHCRKIGMPWLVSVWDLPSVEWMVNSGLPIHAIKIPSARVSDLPLIEAVGKVGNPVILSTGMADMNNVKSAVFAMVNGLWHSRMWEDDDPDWRAHAILLQCTSSYPARADESNLRVIQTYKREFGCPVGFSSHKIGQLTCLLAVAAGANMIERHVTLSRRMKGSDHRMSTEPDDLFRLVREIRQVEAILGSGEKKILDSELPEAKRLGRVL